MVVGVVLYHHRFLGLLSGRVFPRGLVRDVVDTQPLCEKSRIEVMGGQRGRSEGEWVGEGSGGAALVIER